MIHALRGTGVLWPALVLAAGAARGQNPPLPYADDPQVVAQLQRLQPGQSLLLPTRYLRDGSPVEQHGYWGPYARDYTNKMVYAPERQTALYCGGNHGAGRTNDVWEYHLGSNTWHQLHGSEGGDHARFKFALMFYPRLLEKHPDPPLDEPQRQELAAAGQWWREQVAQVDGNFVTRGSGGPLLVGHTWDTLIYDPLHRRLIQGFGAHCANDPVLHHRFAGEPLPEVRARHGRRADGTPWRTPWTFDPVRRQWSPYAHRSPLAELQGMGASLLYLPDQQAALWYYAGQNTPGAPHVMLLWDLVRDTWSPLRANGGQSLGALVAQGLAPESEQQMIYAPAHRRIIAVLGRRTFGFDFATSTWSQLNEQIPFAAHDAETVFAYDEQHDVCLLVRVRESQLAAYEVSTNHWRPITPQGPAIPRPPYSVGFGYFDPRHNLLVIRPAYRDAMWFYRYQ
jgi:hypothetical protein